MKAHALLLAMALVTSSSQALAGHREHVHDENCKHEDGDREWVHPSARRNSEKKQVRQSARHADSGWLFGVRVATEHIGGRFRERTPQPGGWESFTPPHTRNLYPTFRFGRWWGEGSRVFLETGAVVYTEDDSFRQGLTRTADFTIGIGGAVPVARFLEVGTSLNYRRQGLTDGVDFHSHVIEPRMTVGVPFTVGPLSTGIDFSLGLQVPGSAFQPGDGPDGPLDSEVGVSLSTGLRFEFHGL